MIGLKGQMVFLSFMVFFKTGLEGKCWLSCRLPLMISSQLSSLYPTYSHLGNAGPTNPPTLELFLGLQPCSSQVCWRVNDLNFVLHIDSNEDVVKIFCEILDPTPFVAIIGGIVEYLGVLVAFLLLRLIVEEGFEKALKKL